MKGAWGPVKKTKDLAAAVSRRDFIRWSAGALGAVGLMGPSVLLPSRSEAFPPDPFFQGVARMVYHENPWGPHPAALEAVREVMAQDLAGGGINRYHDFLHHELKQAILRYNGLEGVLAPDHVILGVGSAELLFLAADTFTSSDRPFLTEWITYRIILQRAAQNRADVVRVPLKNWKADLDAMVDEAAVAAGNGSPYGLVHFNVINNPVGTFLDQTAFRSFADRLYAASPETVILCDDSDREFMDPSLRPELFWAARDVVDGKNMLHVQTFSHVFGLTGLRIGYGFARQDLVERLEGHRIFSGMNVLGQAAALASLEHAEEQTDRCNRLCLESRSRLYAELDALGLEYLRSQGHYILINLGDLDGTIAVLQMYLTKKVFVRWGSEWDLNNWIRVNPSTDYENGLFIDALEAVLSQRRLKGIAAADYLQTTEGGRLAAAAVKAGFPAHVVRLGAH
jgi:histidinol-phosphate aminotransferase